MLVMKHEGPQTDKRVSIRG